MPGKPRTEVTLPVLEKVLTGIQGLDEITGGGLPKGRPTLVYGAGRLGQDSNGPGVLGTRRFTV